MATVIPQAAGSRDAMSRTNAEVESLALLEDAQEAKTESQPGQDLSLVESAYKDAFSMQTESKRAQVDSIEDRLENLIERQSSRLQQIQSQQPGLFSRSSTRQKWQDQVRSMESTMQRLNSRLEAVREIKEGMGPHGSKLESLAAKKVAFLAPDITKDWFEIQEAQRAHQALMRKKDQEKKQALQREAQEQQGRGLVLGMSVGREK